VLGAYERYQLSRCRIVRWLRPVRFYS